MLEKLFGGIIVGLSLRKKRLAAICSGHFPCVRIESASKAAPPNLVCHVSAM